MEIIAHFEVKEQYGKVRFFPSSAAAKDVMTLIGAKCLEKDSDNWNVYQQAMKNLHIRFAYTYRDIYKDIL